MSSSDVYLRRFARIDAFSAVVGIATSVLELGVITITLKLGEHGLEFAMILGMGLSLVFEGMGGISVLKFGAPKTLLAGLMLKVMAHVSLFCAWWLSSWATGQQIWLALLVSSVFDSVGTGCIISSFRPTYNSWYSLKSNGKTSINYMSAFGYSKIMRSVGPLIAMGFAILMVYIAENGNPREGVSSGAAVISIMIVLRVVQLGWIYQHVRTFLRFSDEKQLKESPKITHAIQKSLSTAADYSYTMIVYLLGNVVFILVVAYFVGLVYREANLVGYPAWIAWMGGAGVGVLVHSGAALLGGWLYPLLAVRVTEIKAIDGGVITIFLVSCISIISCFAIQKYFLITIGVTSLLLYSASMVLTRTANSIISRIPGQVNQGMLFAVLEAVSSLLFIAMLVVALQFPPRGTSGFIVVLFTLCLVSGLLLISRWLQPVCLNKFGIYGSSANDETGSIR
jgi:hypothetical protein